ncbi:CPBP family intramembrane glutamic endopeptidase [Promicromonospora sukumoe]|uniref:CPBP family intramembrane glutamic endopeptidase n=1 Tax=Promicromonospora sukumoe TaxID=88382 RepID=UPI003658CBA6
MSRVTGRPGAGVPEGVPYHLVLSQSVKGRGIWRGILAIVLLYGGLIGFGAIAAQIGGQIDLLFGRSNRMNGGSDFTPVLFATTFASTALLIPWSMLLQRWLYGVEGRSMHSVTGVFRMALLGRAIVVVVPIWALYLVVLAAFEPSAVADWSTGDLLLMFIVSIVLIPLQCAGEEYGYRGLVFRVAAGWGRGARSSLILGVTVSSVVFAVIHGAADPWLSFQFLAAGVASALITWRTGGLETAVVLHAANNSLATMLALALRADLNAVTDRSAGVGSVVFLIPVVLVTVITAVIWYRTRRTGPALTPSGATPSRQGDRYDHSGA